MFTRNKITPKILNAKLRRRLKEVLTGLAGCGHVLALEGASLHPAQLMGITDKKGTLDYNTDADFILLDDSLKVKATYIAGRLVWKHKDMVLKETALKKK